MKTAKGERIAAIAGDLVAAEEMKALKDLFTALGSPNIDCRQDGAKIGGARSSYIFNATITGIEAADAILIIGSDPRKEAPILNARIRKRSRVGGLKVGVIGPRVDLTFDYEHLGAGTDTLKSLASGGGFADVLKNAKAPMIIVGQGALTRADGAAVLAAAVALAKSTGASFNMLHTAAARVAGLDLGLVPAAGGRDVAAILDGASKGEIDVVYLLGADEIDTDKLGSAFVIYQGTHGDKGAHRADVVLPGAAYTEKDGLYANTEGRVQRGNRAAFPPGDAREDWTILRALSATLGKTLPYDTLAALREAIVAAAPHFAAIDEVTAAGALPDLSAGTLDAAPFTLPVKDFHLTNPIARASKTMADCSAELARVRRGAQAAE